MRAKKQTESHWPDSQNPRSNQSDSPSGSSAGNLSNSTAEYDGFEVSLEEYSGPFDVLLSMLSARKLDVTEISLSQITSEFIDYVRKMSFSAQNNNPDDSSFGDSGFGNSESESRIMRNAERISSFLEVASILVEAKSAALIPHDGEMPAEAESMEALRERDLLFARLLQYRAFKRASEDFRALFAKNSGSYAHPAYIGDSVAAALRQSVCPINPLELAAAAAYAFAHVPADRVSIHQLHVPLVDPRIQAGILRERLKAAGKGVSIPFGKLAEDAKNNSEIVVRFLVLLAFFKQGIVQFKQEKPFESLHVRWTGETGVSRVFSDIDIG